MNRSGCEMRTPATVGVSGSAVGGSGVTWRLVAEPLRTGLRRLPLAVAFVALATDLGLGPSVAFFTAHFFAITFPLASTTIHCVHCIPDAVSFNATMGVP
jgi:hypothetical protein